MGIFFWPIDAPLYIIASQAKISRPTGVDWCQFIREVSIQKYK